MAMETDRRTCLSMKGLIFHNGRFLVMRRRNGEDSHWELPGGAMESGAQPEEVLIRGVREETGLPVEVLYPLSTWSRNPDTGQWQIGMIYLCKTSQEVPAPVSMAAEYRWVAAEDAEALKLEPSVAREVADYDFSAILEDLKDYELEKMYMH